MSAGNLHEKSAALFGEAAERIGEKVSTLIGTQVSFTVKQSFPITAEELSGKVRMKAAVLLLESAAGDGRGLVAFRAGDAILFAATLLMMPQSRIAEMTRAGEMEQNLADAFSEVASILYGTLDDLTVRTSPGKGKLRNGGIQFVEPPPGGDFKALFPSGSAFGAEFTVSFPGFDPGTVFLVLEDSFLSALFDVPPVSSATAPGEAPATPAGNRSVLFFGRDAAIAAGIERFLNPMGIETKVTTDIDRAMEWVGSGPTLILAEFSPGPGDEAGRLCRTAVSKGKGIPVVGISDQPTRGTILDARKAGVRAFLVHPFSPELLREKVGPYLA